MRCGNEWGEANRVEKDVRVAMVRPQLVIQLVTQDGLNTEIKPAS